MKFEKKVENRKWIANAYLNIPGSNVNLSGSWYAKNLGFRWDSDPKHNRELKTSSRAWVFLQPDAEYQREPDKVAFGFIVLDI